MTPYGAPEKDDEASDVTGPHSGSDGDDRPSAVPHPDRELADLRRRVDKLVATLDQREVALEAHRAERAVLLDDLAEARRAGGLDGSERSRGWFSRRGDGGGGSMQLLVDANAKLMLENARLQTETEALRKAFHAHVRESQRCSRKDRCTINKLLKHSLSERTARTSRTSLASSLASDVSRDVVALTASQASLRNDAARKSLQSLTASHSSLRKEASRKSLQSSLQSIPEKQPPPPGSADAEDTEPELSRQASQDSTQDEILGTFTEPIPVRKIATPGENFGTSGDDWLAEDDDAEELARLTQAARERRAARKARGKRDALARSQSSSDVLVPRGDAQGRQTEDRDANRWKTDGDADTGRGDTRPHRPRMERRRSTSLREETPLCKSHVLGAQELLVDFGKRPRVRGKARPWASLNTTLGPWSNINVPSGIHGST